MALGCLGVDSLPLNGFMLVGSYNKLKHIPVRLEDNFLDRNSNHKSQSPIGTRLVIKTDLSIIELNTTGENRAVVLGILITFQNYGKSSSKLLVSYPHLLVE